MKTRPKTLRHYQKSTLCWMLAMAEVKRELGIAGPTGSGKTLLLSCFLAATLGRKYTHALVAAPLRNILNQFATGSDKVYLEDNGIAFAVGRYGVEDEPLIDVARTTGTIINYLWGPGGYALACCHASFSRLLGQLLPPDLKGYLLILDEAHHFWARQNRAFVEEWKKRGGSVVKTTATPVGPGGRLAFDEREADCAVKRRSYALHATEGWAPANVEMVVEPFERAVTDPNALDVTAPEDDEEALDVSKDTLGPRSLGERTIGNLVDLMVRRWEELERPKLLIRLPPLIGGLTYQIIGCLDRAFTAAGARTFDASDRLGDRTKALDEFLRDESRLERYVDSKYDVVFASQRFNEGTDWKFCAVVFFLGLPLAQWLVDQVLGRATRDKREIEGYPYRWRNTCRASFFVPRSELAVAGAEAERRAFITCLLLADHSVGRELLSMRAAIGSLQGVFSGAALNAASEKADEALSTREHDRAAMNTAWARMQDDYVDLGQDPTVDRAVDRLQGYCPDVHQNKVHQFVVEKILASNKANAIRCQANFDRALHVGSTGVGSDKISVALQAALNDTLKEFSQEVISIIRDPELDLARRYIAALDPQIAERYAAKLRTKDDPIDVGLVKTALIAYYRTTGERPYMQLGRIAGIPWSTVEIADAMSKGARTMPQYASFEEFLMSIFNSDEGWVQDYASLVHMVEESNFGGHACLDDWVAENAPQWRGKKYRQIVTAIQLLGADFWSARGLTADMAAALGTAKNDKGSARKRREIAAFKGAVLARLEAGEAFTPASLSTAFSRYLSGEAQ